MSDASSPPPSGPPSAIPDAVRVLIVDDDPGDYEMTRAMLDAVGRREARYEVEWASSFDEALAAFEADAHHAYLVDYFLEDRDGLELVRRARAMGLDAPLVMVTGRGSHDVDVEAMQAGASDYLVKGEVTPDSLERTLRYALERVRAQRALRESEARHRGMFDHLPIGLYRCAPDGAFMDANPALVRMLGHPGVAELRERFARHFYVAPEDREAFVETLERDGVVRGFESTLHRGDGTTVRVRNTARTHRGHDGTVAYLEGAVEDVTELEAMERTRGRAQRFRIVFEDSRLPILLLDLEGRILDANPAFRRVLGYEDRSLRGRPVEELVAEDDRPAVVRELEHLARGSGEPLDGERRFLAGDGTILWGRVHAARVEGPDRGQAHLMLLVEEVAEAWIPGR